MVLLDRFPVAFDHVTYCSTCPDSSINIFRYGIHAFKQTYRKMVDIEGFQFSKILSMHIKQESSPRLR